jgi:hypothetical protein
MVTILNSTLEQCPPWTLHAWPPLLWQVGKQIPLRLQHLGTQIMHPGTADACTVGQTLWAWHCSDGDLGMAWDWVQLSPGLVAMADPMAVVSNLLLVDDGGDVLTPYESARHFNAIVHALPWQDEVERALNSPTPAWPASGARQAQRAGMGRRHGLTQ